MISVKNTLEAMMNKFKSIDALDTGIRTKVVTEHINIRKGINNLEALDIDVNQIVSISGTVHYSNYVLPLSYPQLNYGSGGYIEWGLAAVVVSKSLKLISGADWNNCDVKVVISYMGGVKRSRFKAFRAFVKTKMGGVK